MFFSILRVVETLPTHAHEKMLCLRCAPQNKEETKRKRNKKRVNEVVQVWSSVLESLVSSVSCSSLAAAFSALSCSLSCFFHFVRRFWNHVLTCCSVSPSCFASTSLSGTERYFWREKLSSSVTICSAVKTVRAFLDLRL